MFKTIEEKHHYREHLKHFNFEKLKKVYSNSFGNKSDLSSKEKSPHNNSRPYRNQKKKSQKQQSIKAASDVDLDITTFSEQNNDTDCLEEEKKISVDTELSGDTESKTQTPGKLTFSSRRPNCHQTESFDKISSEHETNNSNNDGGGTPVKSKDDQNVTTTSTRNASDKNNISKNNVKNVNDTIRDPQYQSQIPTQVSAPMSDRDPPSEHSMIPSFLNSTSAHSLLSTSSSLNVSSTSVRIPSTHLFQNQNETFIHQTPISLISSPLYKNINDSFKVTSRNQTEKNSKKHHRNKMVHGKRIKKRRQRLRTSNVQKITPDQNTNQSRSTHKPLIKSQRETSTLRPTSPKPKTKNSDTSASKKNDNYTPSSHNSINNHGHAPESYSVLTKHKKSARQRQLRQDVPGQKFSPFSTPTNEVSTQSNRKTSSTELSRRHINEPFVKDVPSSKTNRDSKVSRMIPVDNTNDNDVDYTDNDGDVNVNDGNDTHLYQQAMADSPYAYGEGSGDDTDEDEENEKRLDNFTNNL